MFKRHYLLSALLLALTALVLTACGGRGADKNDDAQQAEIAAAVEATLTVVAADDASADGSSTDESLIAETPDASQDPPTPPPIPISNVTLPPAVNNFDPAPRPASSMGDPNAPVVMYEWSDYT